MSIASFASAAGQGHQQLGSALAPLAFTAPSNAMSLARGGIAATFGQYGLAMRFVVTLHDFKGMVSLGEWSSCRGLRVDLRTQPVNDGGEARGLPTQVAYSPVVLERAVEANASQQLQTWLSSLVTDWRDAPAKPTGTVEIRLYDALGRKAASWTLRDAYPVSWSGPVLDAKQSAVAVETLTFEHEGFLPDADGPAAGGAAAGAGAMVPAAAPSKTTEASNRASLGPAGSGDGADEAVVFTYTPTTIVMSHAARVVPSAGLGQATAAGISGPGPSGGADLPAVAEVEGGRATTSIGVHALILEGGDVAGRCRRLLRWSEFEAVPGDAKSTNRAELPRLTFSWGAHHLYLVHLTQVTVAYTRFNQGGKPIRATVDLTLHVIPRTLRPTNPSSGGLPGRRTHLLTGAESLPALATRCYGGPGRWREIAAANGVEDPLRVRPGTLVYLPSTQETGR